MRGQARLRGWSVGGGNWPKLRLAQQNLKRKDHPEM